MAEGVGQNSWAPGYDGRALPLSFQKPPVQNPDLHEVESTLLLIDEVRQKIQKHINFFSRFPSYDEFQWEALLEELDEMEAELQILSC